MKAFAWPHDHLYTVQTHTNSPSHSLLRCCYTNSKGLFTTRTITVKPCKQHWSTGHVNNIQRECNTHSIGRVSLAEEDTYWLIGGALAASDKSSIFTASGGHGWLNWRTLQVLSVLANEGLVGLFNVKPPGSDVAFESIWRPSAQGLGFDAWRGLFWAAEVAAPMRKEWLEKLSAGKPDCWRMDLRVLLESKMNNRFIGFVYEKGSWGDLAWVLLRLR